MKVIECVEISFDVRREISIEAAYQSSNQAKMSGATMVASLSTMNFGVSMSSFPQVIFSFGTAPEYEP